LPIDDNNNLVNQGSRDVINSTGLSDLTPPQYGEHQFDQLYSDIDLSGYMTPAGAVSGVTTPNQARSRCVSADNLASMDALTSNDFGANILQNRLNNLDVAGTNRTTRDRSQLSTSGDGLIEHEVADRLSPDGVPSIPRQNSVPNGSSLQQSRDQTGQHIPSEALSRRESEEDQVPSGTITPQHVEYSAEILAKVPSYTTALQANHRKPLNEGLPSYQTATRRPLPTPLMPQAPGQAHVQLVGRGST